MITRDKALSMIGLAARAGKVASGEFSTEKAVKSSKAHLVIVALDASDNTKKMFRNMCDFYKVPFHIYGTKEFYNDFKNRFYKIRKARNGIAHGHENECLTDADRKEVDSYCQEFFKIVRENLSPDAEFPKEGSKYYFV